MDIVQPEIVVRVVFILGIINLVSAGLIFSSCRCIPGLKIASRLLRYPAYKRVYKYHCYVWWVFWPSVVVHAIFAIVFFGIPLI